MTDLFTPAPGDETPIGPPLVYCGNCAHHDLEAGGLAEHGYGLCNARPEHSRKAFYTCEANRCRIGKFTPKQPTKGL